MSGGFARRSLFEQSKITGGEKGGDLLDNKIERVFWNLHMHLPKHKADVSSIRLVMGSHRGDYRIGFARSFGRSALGVPTAQGLLFLGTFPRTKTEESARFKAENDAMLAR